MPLKCVVIGAGPVGALAGLYAARRGWQVDVYDLRPDLRDEATTPLNFTKSINLALSERGINALRCSDSPHLLKAIMAETIPMYGRMIHGQDNTGALTEASQQYDIHGRAIMAVDRGDLNARLLDELESLPNVKLRFNHKLTGIDFRRRLAWLEQKGTSRRPSNETDAARRSRRPGRPDEVEIDFDLIMGCDGAHSSVRFHMMKYARLDFEQSYIDTLWCEFSIPAATEQTIKTPSARDGFATSPNHLHIWPGKDKMFIAIPSVDKSFTSTLFAPDADFQELKKDPSKVELFFNKHFPGAVDLIGPEAVQRQFEENPHLPLISVKCAPHYFGSSGVILGDAAHAMVPFYGQGMNAGLEDVRVLFSYLDRYSTSEEGRGKALSAYNQERIADAHTINDLALDNFWDMREGVRSSLVLLRKRIEELLSEKLPATGFATQYSRVSFSNERYSEIAKAVARQKNILLRGISAAGLIPMVSIIAFVAWRWHRGRGTPGILASVRFATRCMDQMFRSTFGTSTLRNGQRNNNPVPTHNVRTRLAKSLDQCLPAADNAKTTLSTQPEGWAVFVDERERNGFIKCALLVLSDNGTHTIDHLPVEMFYPLCSRGYAAEMAVMDGNIIRHSVVGQKYGESPRHAFVYLKHEIERQLDIIMRRKHNVVSTSTETDDWNEPLARKLRKMQSQQSVQSARRGQPSRKASRQSLPPATPSSATPDDLTRLVAKLPASKRRSLIVECASPDDLNELYNIPESTAMAAKRRSALFIPPLDSQAWNETRLIQPRSDSMPSSSTPTKRASRSTPTTSDGGGRASNSNKAAATTGTALAATNTTMAQLPMIQRAGRYSSGGGASRQTNDQLVYSNGQYRHRSAMYELSYFGKEDLYSQSGGDIGGPSRGGGAVGPGVALQREGAVSAGAGAGREVIAGSLQNSEWRDVYQNWLS